MISHFEPGQVMAVGFGAMAVSYLAFGAGQSATWLVAGCVVVVLGEVLFTPSFDIWIGRKVPEERLAKAMGAMHFFRSAGNMLGSLTAGLLFDLSRSTGVAGLNWYIVAGVACVGVAICLNESGRKTAGEPARSPA
jgi:MFS family permease